MEEVTETKVVGDIFNNKGNKNAMILSRVNQSVGVTSSMLSTCSEVTLGIFYINVLLLLYETVFIKKLLFNSDAWSALSVTNIKSLEVAQTKCLKRIMKVASSTPNSFTLIELGVLPIKYEIEIKQLVFIHHILNLETIDPVRALYDEMLQYPFANNWARNVNQLRQTYSLPHDDEEIAKQSPDEWKKTVKMKVVYEAHKELLQMCKSKKKTSSLSFSAKFDPQPYLISYTTKIAISIFKIRGKSTNCLANRGSNENCRLCGLEPEDQEHVLNCEQIRNGGRVLSLHSLQNEVLTNDEVVKEIAERFLEFQEKIEGL